MINLKPSIERIKALLAEDTQAYVTYAALEARLALELVCYERLRAAHKYISTDQVARWQPKDVVNQLIQDVDANVAQTFTFSMSVGPIEDDQDPDNLEYMEIGTQIGFEPKLIGKLWNALSNVALHIPKPTSSDQSLLVFSEKEVVKAKVQEAVKELERLSKATLSFSGALKEVSFTCSCGTINKRHADMLREGQEVYCINPSCKQTWKVNQEGNEIRFESLHEEIQCQNCSHRILLPLRVCRELKRDQVLSVNCASCGHKNFGQVRFVQVRVCG